MRCRSSSGACSTHFDTTTRRRSISNVKPSAQGGHSTRWRVIARRLQTVMEKLLEEVSFEAEDRQGQTLVVDGAYVDKQLAAIARNTDLSRFVL